jgi:hypothetical protein
MRRIVGRDAESTAFLAGFRIAAILAAALFEVVVPAPRIRPEESAS